MYYLIIILLILVSLLEYFTESIIKVAYLNKFKNNIYLYIIAFICYIILGWLIYILLSDNISWFVIDILPPIIVLCILFITKIHMIKNKNKIAYNDDIIGILLIIIGIFFINKNNYFENIINKENSNFYNNFFTYK
jgi:hypothetical protein